MNTLILTLAPYANGAHVDDLASLGLDGDQLRSLADTEPDLIDTWCSDDGSLHMLELTAKGRAYAAQLAPEV